MPQCVRELCKKILSKGAVADIELACHLLLCLSEGDMKTVHLQKTIARRLPPVSTLPS